MPQLKVLWDYTIDVRIVDGQLHIGSLSVENAGQNDFCSGQQASIAADHLTSGGTPTHSILLSNTDLLPLIKAGQTASIGNWRLSLPDDIKNSQDQWRIVIKVGEEEIYRSRSLSFDLIDRMDEAVEAEKQIFQLDFLAHPQLTAEAKDCLEKADKIWQQLQEESIDEGLCHRLTFSSRFKRVLDCTELAHAAQGEDDTAIQLWKEVLDHLNVLDHPEYQNKIEVRKAEVKASLVPMLTSRMGEYEEHFQGSEEKPSTRRKIIGYAKNVIEHLTDLEADSIVQIEAGKKLEQMQQQVEAQIGTGEKADDLEPAVPHSTDDFTRLINLYPMETSSGLEVAITVAEKELTVGQTRSLSWRQAASRPVKVNPPTPSIGQIEGFQSVHGRNLRHQASDLRFSIGDEIRFNFTINKLCSIILLNLATDGTIIVPIPSLKQEVEEVSTPNQVTRLPEENNWVVAEPTGNSLVKLIGLSQPKPILESWPDWSTDHSPFRVVAAEKVFEFTHYLEKQLRQLERESVNWSEASCAFEII